MKSRRQKLSVDSDVEDLIDSEFQAEDSAAIGPKSGRRSNGKLNRKALQLCRQVSDTLNSVLSGESGDDLLQSLYVESVTPAPDATQVLVTVQVTDAELVIPESEILGRLRLASGWLRSEVAAAITRRHTPNLVFQLRLKQARNGLSTD